MSDTSKPPVKRAAFLTFVGLLAIASLVAMPLLAGEPADDVVSQWERFLGRFHPVVLHLPIGMFALLLLLEIGGLFSRQKPRRSTLVPAFFTAVSAIVAVICGFLLYQSNPGEYGEELISDHLWWGIGFACAMVACTILMGWIEVAAGKGRWIYLLALLTTGGIMGVASHDGGSITHGRTYLTDEAPDEVREIYNRLVPEDERLPLLRDGAGADDLEMIALPREELVAYAHWVQPIFDQKCVSCHGPDRQRGKLRMDSFDALLVGGDEGAAIKPGNAFDSNLIFRIDLPLDDEEHMPPEDKPQLEDHERAIVEWWIDSGASPDAKVVDLDVPTEIDEAVSKLIPPEVLAAREAAKREAAQAEAEAREEIAATLETLREEFPTGLNFESRASSNLVFTAVSMRKNFDDEALAKLEPVAPALVSVDLSGTGITDEGLQALAGAENLRQLRLSETAITDAAFDTLGGLVSLESLNLYGTGVTAEGVLRLVDLPNLRRLYLWQTGVDEDAAETLGEQMPETEIILGTAFEPQ